MKKIVFFLAFLLVPTSFCKAQVRTQRSVLKDAMQLSAMKGKVKSDTDKIWLGEILTYYGIRSQSALDSNVFLASILPHIVEERNAVGSNGGTNESGGGSGQRNSAASVLSSVGALDVTNIADGFAKFLVKRTRQELSITFFVNFKSDLGKYPDLKTVFPNTYTLLNTIDQDLYNYSSYLNNLRDAFRSDLLVIDQHLPDIIENHRDVFSKSGNFEFGLALKTGCFLSSSLRSDMHPGDILDAYPVSFFEGAPAADTSKLIMLKGAIQSLQLLSESMIETDTAAHSYWVSAEKIRDLVNNKEAMEIYFGLLLQLAREKYQQVPFGNSETFYNRLNKKANIANFDKDYSAYKQYLLSFGGKVSQLNQMIKNYQQPASDSLKIEQYAKYFKSTTQLISSCVQVSTLPFMSSMPGIDKLLSQTKVYFDIANETTDLAIAINRKRYPEAVNHLVIIYSSAVVKPADASGNTDSLQQIAPSKNQISAGASGKKDKIGKFAEEANSTLSFMAKYGAFMASIVTAQNSDDIEKAIDDIALPAGSARIKRQSKVNVAVNAYCGLFIGNEVIKGVDEDVPFQNWKTRGITAPIGLSFSQGNRILPWPLSYLIKARGFSSSVFVSLVDLGAVTAFRFTNDTAAQVPTIQLKDIFSPGMFWSVGIPRSPISVNIGAQFGPNLRKVTTTTGNDYSNNIYVRYSVSVCVDLPVLNLYNKTR